MKWVRESDSAATRGIYLLGERFFLPVVGEKAAKTGVRNESTSKTTQNKVVINDCFVTCEHSREHQSSASVEQKYVQ